LSQTAVSEMYGFQVKRPSISSDNVKQWFYEELNKRKIICPMKWYLTQEPSVAREHPAALESLFRSPTFWNAPNHRQYIEALLRPQLTDEVICKIAEQTKLQFDSVLFCQLRPCRLTASNFGFVINAVLRNSFPKTLFQKILGANWEGKENEEKERKKVMFHLIG
jgi:hypothetical protein